MQRNQGSTHVFLFERDKLRKLMHLRVLVNLSSPLWVGQYHMKLPIKYGYNTKMEWLYFKDNLHMEGAKYLFIFL